MKAYYFNILVVGLVGIFSNFYRIEAYQAAVVAYKPLNRIDWISHKIITENVKNCVKKIEEAKGKAEIIVFPEYGLTTIDAMDKAKEHLSSYSMVLSKLDRDICNDKEADSNLVPLSCAAKSANMYVVFNIVEAHNDTYYLTSVVLDKKGKIALRCRKNNLPPNSSFSKDINQQPCKFSANFDSGSSELFIMFDEGLYGSVPGEVDSVILTSAVENTIPFNYAPSVQAGFAAKHQVNLLVAGYYDSKKGYGGTGIYNIKGNKLIANATLGPTISTENDLIIFKEVQLKKPKKQKISIQIEVEFNNQQTMKFLFDNVTSEKTNNTEYNKCVQDICCKFEADLDQKSIYPYEWVVFHNKTTVFGRKMEVIYCALIKPEETSVMKFKNVTVSSKYSNTLSEVLPMAIQNNYKIPIYIYHESGSDSSLYLTKDEELISFGIIHILRSPNGVSKIECLTPSFMLVAILLWLGN